MISGDEITKEVSYVIDRLGQHLRKWALAYREKGRTLTELDLDKVVARMAATVPSVSVWDEQVGPFYDTSGAQKLLEVTRQALHERVSRMTLLGLKTAEGVLVYPIWQFRGTAIIPGLSEVLEVFRGTKPDPWLIASWMKAPQAALKSMSVADWLAHDVEPEIARNLATAAAGRWSQ